ncbi:complex I NDUFA9 subunit family protein [Candidatus Paracaedibacter symbiosus]|uniref:complex I NDUFA9 subunit family protein n=1 Tax=Candidatus Paracaedibacter symbiosus TaxID=244582 RepID=UPI00050964DF|nr:complex I NDUFA9 subunit family protein [Candidatus Paracaedibacter symbiosus]
MQNKVVTVLGGSGFIGRHVVQRLAAQGALIKVGCRDINQAMHLLPMGTVGQIKLIPTNVRDTPSLHNIIKGSDCVINLVGILYESGKQSFQAIHVEAAQKIAEICEQEGVQKLLHFSALGAKKESSSVYARTKAEGEVAVRAAFEDAIIFRPSVVYGAEDRFFNLFAEMATLSPILPLMSGGHTKFQPVFVGDVAEAVVAAIFSDIAEKTYELGGPTIYTLRQLIQLLLKTINRSKILLPIPRMMGYGIGLAAQLLPNPLITVDQVRLLKSDNVLMNSEAGFAAFGIKPKAIEAILPTYLRRFHKD